MNRLKKGFCFFLILIWIPCVCLGGDVLTACGSLLSADSPRSVEFSVLLKEYIPFGKERLSMLNDLLRHMSFRICEGENEGSVSILSDGKEVFGFHQWGEKNAESFSFSFEPDTVYSGGSLQDLTGSPSVQTALLSFEVPAFLSPDKITWVDKGFALLERLPEVFPEYTRSQDVNTKLKDVGLSVRKAVITIAQKDVKDNVMTRLGDSVSDKALHEFLLTLSFSGRQQFTLYYDENGALMKANYSGQAGRGKDMRKVNIEWRGQRGNDIFDDLIVKAPPVNGKNRDTLTLKRTEKKTDEEDTLQASFEWTRIRGRVKSIINGAADISLRNNETELIGNATLTSETDGRKTGLSVSPDFALNPETGWNGSMGIKYLSGENAVIDAEIKAASLSSALDRVTRPEKALNLGEMNEEEKTDLSARIQHRIASILLRALLKLPEEDLRFLNYEMSDEIWQQVLPKAIPSSEGGFT